MPTRTAGPAAVTLKDPSRYHAELSEFRVSYSKAGCVVSIVLVLGGVALDYSLYPERVPEFFAARVLVALLSAAVFGLLYTPLGRSNVRSLTLLWLALPQIMIGVMIAQSEGVQSIYFIGLHLALYAVGIILPTSFAQGVAFGLFTYLVYVAACFWHPSGLSDLPGFVGRSLFLLFSASASAGCTWFNERARHRLFSLQHEVSEKNASLVSTNAALAEVKGHLLQQEKMAALGTLSAGLLHEVNNPVNFSVMAIQSALTMPVAKKDPMLKECLDDALEGMHRVQNIVSDLKTFAYQKPGENTERVFRLEKAVESALRLTGFDLKNIDVVLDLPLDTHVLGDEPAIIGVLINLFSNAALALGTKAAEDPRIEVSARPLNHRLRLAVRDNGPGIAPENLARVFEPFFTTRDVGQGLGLGLSVSYGIVQRHGGTLSVASEFGEWTEFSFDLALASPTAEGERIREAVRAL
jgi:two-component system sensor histidine kinase PhcS